LASQNVPLRRIAEGVYEVQVLTSGIRIVVANQLPLEEHNAMLHLFSIKAELMAYGVRHYRVRSEETSTLLLQLYQRYQQEGQIMADMLEEFARETINQLLKDLPVEKRLEGLTPEQVLKAIPAEKFLEGLTPEQLKAFPVEKFLKGLSAEQLVRGLPAETLRELREKLKGNGTSPKP
jgi:hypothetical protein